VTERFPLLVPGGTTRAADVAVRAPFDGADLGGAAAADASVVETALATASRLFRDRGAWLPAFRRVEILERAAHLLAARAEEFALAAAREGGKPLVDSRVEAARAVDGLKLCVEAIRGEHGREVQMGSTPASAGRVAFTTREPVGVVVAVSAFNHPLNLIVHQAGPAIAAGCPVIVKPSEETPLTCLRFVRLLREAGLPDDWCQPVVTRDVALAQSLVTDRRVAFLSFIGSAAVGWMLRSKLAPGARCALEHGGVAPVIVAADADLARIVPLLVKGGFYHAGQVCVSVQRIYAARAIAAELTQRLADAAGKLVVGDPARAETEVGPLIRHRETDRVDEWVREAAAGGAKVACGGRRISASCYAPTVIAEPRDDARVSRLEVFGPVVCVNAFDDVDDAIRRANSLPFAFQAAVCTRDLDFAMRCFRRLDASAVMVNDHTAFRVDWMPFAGLRESGLGVGGIAHTVRDMQTEKMLVIRSPEL
jgi:acyl-CoA reductase-like NAD-dependent aldehyde dehydrogenase